MSTQRFMSRICKSPGRFTFAMLLGVLLALPCLLPAAVFARVSGQAGALSLSSAPDASPTVLTKVGVSVVRLVAVYGTTGNQVTCTGLGVLVASQSPSGASKNYMNWVLTDGNLISTKMTTCGKLGDTLALSSLEVWAGSEYTGGSMVLLGSLTCINGIAACRDALPASMPDSIILPPATPASYTLFSFQSVAGEPYIGLSSSNDTTGVNVGLTNPALTKGPVVYPYKNVDANNSPTANYKDYLTPAIVSDPPATQKGTADQSPGKLNPIEGGTPEVSAQGQLVGMWVNNSGGGYTSLPANMFQALLQAHGLPLTSTSIASTQTCTVAACWDSGIDAYNASNYKVAHTDLSQVSKLNPRFIAAQTFDALASKHLSGESARPVAIAQPQPTSPPILGPFSLEEVILAALILLILVVVVVLIVRIRKRRRELALIANEWQIGRKTAEQEALQKQAQATAVPPAPQVTQVSCPNCRKPVYLTDTMCPACRYPLSPSASGMGVRLMGNAPLVSAPLPPLPSAISDVPTMPITPSVETSPPTMKRAQFQAREEPTQDIQQVRGRNLSLAVGTRSDPGIKRKHKPNEDSMFAFQWDRTHNSQHQQFGLFVVADGMGGHANGQDASRLAIQTMIDFMLPRVISGTQMSDEAFLKLMGDGVQASNQAVHGRNMESHADMGTTMTAALVVGATAYVANVGDSRTYLYREGQGLSKVTHDHSVVASLVDAGIIKPDDVYTHPKRNQIYRSLGEKPIVEVDTFPVNLLPGDKLLLCSDGLWDMVRDPSIQEVLGKTTGDPNETGQKLIKAALEGGGEDNVSVIVVQFAEMQARTGMTGVQLLAKPETVTVPNLPPI